MGSSNNSRNIQNTELSNKEKKYLYSIKKTMRILYKELDNNENSINKAIEKKYFDKIITIRNVQINNNKKIINKTWKKYILNYFKSKENSESYFSYIINEIEDEIFLFENKYVSSAFFKEFELMTKPKIFQDIDKKSLKENEKNSNDENIVKQLMRVTYNENIKENNINNSIITVPNYIKYLGGSFKIDNISQSQSLDNTTYEYHLIRKRIKEIIKIFKKHLENKDHPITIIISIFEKYFTNYLTKKKIFLKNNNYFGIENFNNYIIKELHSFILICQSTLKLMYSKSFDLQCLSEEKDETTNLITIFLFQTGHLYKEIYELFSIELKQKLEAFSIKLQLLNNITPKDLIIPEKFALDESTEKYKEKLKNDFILSEKKENNMKEQNTIKISNSSLNIENEIQMNKIIDTKPKNLNGYKSAIQLIKALKNNKGPFNKMMIIALLSREIEKCVNKYWEGMEQYITNSLLNINADELMNIFIYIIIKSQMPELLIHNKIISEFTTRTTQQSTMGYYFITLEAAIVYIQNDLFKQMNLYNEYDELIHKNKNILDSDNDIINTSKQKK